MATVQMFMELQVLLTVFLVTLFRFLQDRLPHREFFRLWTCAWLWFGIFLAFGRLSFALGPEWTLVKGSVVLLSTLAGFVQVPLFLLGAFSLRRKIRRRWLRLGITLSLLAGTVSFSLSLLAAADMAQAYAIRSVPRQTLLSLACFSGAAMLWTWRKRRSRGVVVTALSCLVGGVLYLMNALRVAHPLLRVESGIISILLAPFSFDEVRWFYLDVIWQCGIALGMILFLLEDYARAETALRQSERKFSKAFHSSPDIIFISDDAGRLMEVNASFARITGHERQAMGSPSSEGWMFWVDPAEAQRMQAILRKQGSVQDMELLFRTHAGDVRVGLVSAERMELDGQPCALYVVRDITDRKRVEEALRSIAQGTASPSRDFFVSLVRHLATALHVRYAFVTECTDSARSRLRTLAFWKGDALAGNVEYPVAGGPCATVVLGQLTHYPENLAALFPEDTALRKMSAESYIGIPLLDSAGEVIGHLAVMHDQPLSPNPVSMQILQIFAARAGVELERDRAMRALQASQERYRDLVENANDVIYSHDLEGQLTSLNMRGEQMLGCAREEILGRNVRELVAQEHLPRVDETLNHIRKGNDAAVDLEVVSQSGARMWLEINARPIVTDGEPVGVQGIARDITDRKLLEDQLRQAQKMEAVGQLAGGVAHDFNNLLMVISGYGDLLLEHLDASHPGRRSAEQILKAADRASALTRQLLAFSRKQVLQPRVLDLNHLILELGKMLPRVIREDITLTILPGANLGRVLADPNQIEQVIMNLVVNARDAMPRGGRLTIETDNIRLNEAQPVRHASMPPGEYTLLAVSDTGIGMDAATQRRIFEPFFTTKEQGKGTGLGLATVYGIVKQSGGYIWVYSEPGQGTTFKIYLPRVSDSTEPAGTAVEPATFGGTETILLVEDEDEVRSLTREFLTSSGYQVVEARDPAEAIVRSAGIAGQLHLIITDVVMPGMSGPELANHLLIHHPQARVLYVSGYAEEAIVHHGILDRGATLVDKPFNRRTLTQKVRELLDRPYAGEESLGGHLSLDPEPLAG